MRKLLIVLLAANLGFLAVRLARDAFAGGATTTVIGDANGDLLLDIADPVYLLEHLFLGGPPPAAFAGSSDLDARVAALEDLLQNFRRDGDTVVVEGANLQVVNGTGSTGFENGAGNIIVGYNEERTGNENVPGLAPNERTGSHNLILGRRNNYTSHGAIVAGSVNASNAPFASVLGGLLHVADEEREVLGGAPEGELAPEVVCLGMNLWLDYVDECRFQNSRQSGPAAFRAVVDETLLRNTSINESGDLEFDLQEESDLLFELKYRCCSGSGAAGNQSMTLLLDGNIIQGFPLGGLDPDPRYTTILPAVPEGSHTLSAIGTTGHCSDPQTGTMTIDFILLRRLE